MRNGDAANLWLVKIKRGGNTAKTRVAVYSDQNALTVSLSRRGAYSARPGVGPERERSRKRASRRRVDASQSRKDPAVAASALATVPPAPAGARRRQERVRLPPVPARPGADQPVRRRRADVAVAALRRRYRHASIEDHAR